MKITRLINNILIDLIVISILSQNFTNLSTFV